MKTALLLSLMTVSMITTAHAKSLIGSVDSYIIAKSGTVVSIGSNEIEDDGSTATFFSYALGKKITVNMSELSKSTRSEIADVKAGESVLINTPTVSGNNITRTCVVFNLFENKQAYVGCKTYEADAVAGYNIPQRLDYIIQNVESGVVPEVANVENFSKGDKVELTVATKTIKAGKSVRILALYKNGQALVEPTLAGINFLNSSGILNRFGIERVSINDLR
ncbi:MAG: hypothetical protein H7177_10690 [Rhizobacter sp.]|nr:hypothetical protein [Bacteriovorax sp.]